MTTALDSRETSTDHTRGIKLTTVTELTQMIADDGELALLDVRDGGVFSAGHIFVACSVPLNAIEYLIDSMVPRRTTRIVLVDDTGASDGLAVTAARKLIGWGYNNVQLLHGGLQAWIAAGNQAFSGVYVPSKAFGEYVEHECGTPCITAGTLSEWKLSGKDILMLDSRPYEEFTRYSLPGGIACPGAELVHRVFGLIERPDTTIVINCAGRTRGIIGAQSLINAGITNPVVVVENGTAGWYLSGQEMAEGRTEIAPPPTAKALQQAIAASEIVAHRFGVKQIDAQELDALRSQTDRNVYLFDVRTPEEFKAGHLSNSRSAPGGQLVQSTDHYVGVRNACLILVDDNGVRARMTASWLLQMGWKDVYVLRDGLHTTGDPLSRSPQQQTTLGADLTQVAWISVFELRDAQAAGGVLVLDLDTSLAYKGGHLPGSWFGVRSRLKACLGKLPAHQRLVLTSADGGFAAMTYGEARSITDAPVCVLSGGTHAWHAAGLPLETGLQNMTTENDDIWYSPYDYENRRESMTAYLQWEVDLLAQIHGEGGVTFNCTQAQQGEK